MVELRRSTRKKSSDALKRAPEEEEVTPNTPKTKKAKTNGSKSELEVGDESPDVVLKNQDGEEVSFKDVVQQNKVVVVFAYPKASTPGCTKQACGFRDNYEELKKNAAVFGLSTDTPNAQQKFQEKHSFPFDLLSDPQRKLIGPLGASKSPSGTKRSYWVFAHGKLRIKRISVSPEASVSEAKKEAAEAVQADDNKDAKEEAKEELDGENSGGDDGDDDSDDDEDFKEHEGDDPELEEVGQEEDEEYGEGDLKKDEDSEADVEVENGDSKGAKEEANELQDGEAENEGENENEE
ncbi:LAQU0S04e04808g1_1 [Lachancea quebecensis]|uniref:thioredoxin-dependent peroxiredoxin n=1 Tax=Lachancea quebecensis TaxID=1654605 RepID=A0A0P1KQ11_9SACH|nr:LAQU0S04e04808g1_1 [Lachancea quebecensis]